jgi:hypothetical protein
LDPSYQKNDHVTVKCTLLLFVLSIFIGGLMVPSQLYAIPVCDGIDCEFESPSNSNSTSTLTSSGPTTPSIINSATSDAPEPENADTPLIIPDVTPRDVDLRSETSEGSQDTTEADANVDPSNQASTNDGNRDSDDSEDRNSRNTGGAGGPSIPFP